MPQSWSGQWPLPTGNEPLRAELDRNRLIHTIGNLTLATSSLNSTMSNHSWEDKREHLAENSVLHLNKRILSRDSKSTVGMSTPSESGARSCTSEPGRSGLVGHDPAVGDIAS